MARQPGRPETRRVPLPLLDARVAAVAVAAAVLFRAFCIVRAPFDTDEPQHLHIAWAWWDGLVAYRDFFDNHMPLFHMVAAPLVGAIGERVELLWLARLLMLPFAAGMIVLTYVVARRIYIPAVAFWCAVCASLVPPLLLKGVEFRNDNATILLGLAAVVVILPGLTPWRVFAGSVILGAGFMISIKTGILVAALFLAVASTHRLTLRLVAPAAGFAIVPAMVAAFFASEGALRQLVFGVYQFNRLYPSHPARTYTGAILFLPVVAMILLLSRRWKTTREHRLLVLTCAYFVAVTLGFWPIITNRDWLPILPLLAILVAGAIVTRWPRLAPALPLLLMLWTVEWGDLWLRPSREPVDLVAETLRLTRPAEPVLDLKGETIFRTRPTYFTLDRVGRTLIQRDLISDTIVQDVVARRCHVVAPDSHYFPPATRQFLRTHFVEGTGLLRVAGQRVGADRRFEIVVPGMYSFVGDGAPLTRPSDSPLPPGEGAAMQRVRGLFYEAGTYLAPLGANAVVWSPALERGFALPAPSGPSRSRQSS